MALSALDDEAVRPGEGEIRGILGETAELWFGLIGRLAAAHPTLEEDMGFRGAKWGWSLRLKLKGRVIVYLTPCAGYFLAGFALGEKAVQAARGASLPSPVMEVIEGARKYAEGRGVRIEVRNCEDMKTILRLAEIKISN
jgi:hypothetical protein